MNRRMFLTGSATALTAVSGGCLAVPEEQRDGVILTHVELGNATDDPQSFDVLVTHDDEIVHWSLHDVAPDEDRQDAGGKVIDIAGPEAFGNVEVHVRVDTEWARTDFDTDKYDGEHVIAVATYGMIEDDALRISRVISDRSTTSTT